MELLAPAGNLLAAYSALKGGADAIYLGGKKFSARASADNFSNEEIEEITKFAHSINKKIYVTLNTLLFQDEFFQAVEFAQFLNSINIDGLIVQDLGLAHYLHKTLPSLSLNASTQLNCHNVRQAEALIAVGFKRIVLAREVNLETIKAIKALGVEVEVFGHGALCVSYSGNCLMSSFIGGRSGNRGRCAQPCRMSYDIYEDDIKIKDNIFALSTKDLMTINYIKELIEVGVDSLKIEGRLKSNEYIYTVSKVYRHAIDTYREEKTNSQSIEELTKIYSRKFTKGYIFDESPFKLLNQDTSSHQGVEIGKVIKANKNRITIKLNDTLHRLDGIRFNTKEQYGCIVDKIFLNRQAVEEAYENQIIEIIGIENAYKYLGASINKTKDYLLTKKIEKNLQNSIKIPIFGYFKAKLNAPISLIIEFNNYRVEVFGEFPAIASGEGTKIDRVIEQLKKSGEHPYFINNLNLEMDKCFIPISAINKLRNDAFIALKEKINTIKPLAINKYSSDIKYQGFDDNFFFLNHSNSNLNYMDNCYSIKNNKAYLSPRITSEFPNNKNLISHFIVKNVNKQNITASQYCNITNSYALDCFFELGFNKCILSTELDISSIHNLIIDFENRHGFKPNIGVIVYGKIDMMIMKSCPIGSLFNNKAIHCERCHIKKYEIKDIKGVRYHLVGDQNCNMKVLLDKPIYLLDQLSRLDSQNFISKYLIFSDENKDEIDKILKEIENNNFEYNFKKHTRGHFINRPL